MQPEIFVSQFPYRVPGLAMMEARHIKNVLQLPSIGVELMPLRIDSAFALMALSRVAGVDTAVAGVTTVSQADFERDLAYFQDKPDIQQEIRMNRLVIGAQDEPTWTRVFGTHLNIALTLGAKYLAMHEEPTAYLQDLGQLPRWATTDIPYLRKNGWGPEDNRPSPLSWNIDTIQRYIEARQAFGWNMGAILATDTLLRGGRYGLREAWDTLRPEVIQIADGDPVTKEEKLPPGKNKDQLANLIQESSRVCPKTIFTVEVAHRHDVIPTVEYILKNFR